MKAEFIAFAGAIGAAVATASAGVSSTLPFDVLLTDNQQLPGLGQLERVFNASINDAGEWAAESRIDLGGGPDAFPIIGPGGLTNTPLGVLSNPALQTAGAPALLGIGQDGSVFTRVDLQPIGETNPEAGLTSWVFEDLSPVANSSQSFNDRGETFTYRFFAEQSATNGNGTFIFNSLLDGPGPEDTEALVLREPGASDRILVAAGDGLPGVGTVTIPFLAATPSRPSFNDAGTWAAPVSFRREDNSNGRALLVDGQPVAFTGMDPAPTSDGRSIVGVAEPLASINDAAQLGYVAELAGAARGDTIDAIMLDSTPILAEGGIAQLVDGTTLDVSRLLVSNLFTLPSGDVLWSGEIRDDDGPFIGGLFLNDQQVVGELVNLYDVSDSGEWAIISTVNASFSFDELVRVRIPAPGALPLLAAGAVFGARRRRS
ncbi:MAG: hypothetical protein AAGD00_03885 [Planctomycetota bacterium]